MQRRLAKLLLALPPRPLLLMLLSLWKHAVLVVSETAMTYPGIYAEKDKKNKEDRKEEESARKGKRESGARFWSCDQLPQFLVTCLCVPPRF